MTEQTLPQPQGPEPRNQKLLEVAGLVVIVAAIFGFLGYGIGANVGPARSQTAQVGSVPIIPPMTPLSFLPAWATNLKIVAGQPLNAQFKTGTVEYNFVANVLNGLCPRCSSDGLLTKGFDPAVYTFDSTLGVGKKAVAGSAFNLPSAVVYHDVATLTVLPAVNVITPRENEQISVGNNYQVQYQVNWLTTPQRGFVVNVGARQLLATSTGVVFSSGNLYLLTSYSAATGINSYTWNTVALSKMPFGKYQIEINAPDIPGKTFYSKPFYIRGYH